MTNKTNSTATSTKTSAGSNGSDAQQGVATGEVVPADSRYLVDGLNNPLGNVLVQISGIGGAALAVVYSSDIAAMASIEPSMIATIAFAIAGYLLGNLAAQFTVYLGRELGVSFVPKELLGE